MNAYEYCKAQLRHLIINDALRFGDFTLASGKKSDYYIDCKQVTLNSGGAFFAAHSLLGLMQCEDIDAVGGAAMGAIPIAVATSMIAKTMGCKLDVFIVRDKAKEHGTKSLVEGPLSQDASVVVVDDVVTTGNSTIAAVNILRQEYNAQIVLVAAIVDRQEGAREIIEQAGLRFESLFTINELR